MCRFLAYWGEEKNRFDDWLITSENNLLQQSRQDASGRPNPDGWGIAYRDHEGIQLFRSKTPAYQDPHFPEISRRARGDLLFAHVRRMSHGERDVRNAHPFVHGNWLFMHNGTIPNFPHIRRELSRKLYGNDSIATGGETDSEFLFRYFLYWFRKNKNCDSRCVMTIIYQIIQQIIRLTPEKELPKLALNFVLTNGNYLLGFRRRRTLFYRNNQSGTILSSEPLDSEKCWNEVPENHFILCPRPTDVQLISYNFEMDCQESHTNNTW